MAEPDQQPTYAELLKYCEQLNAVTVERTQELERFMLSVRRFRALEQSILLLVGAVSGIAIYRLWAGL